MLSETCFWKNVQPYQTLGGFLKGRIGENGILYIERVGEEKQTRCKYAPRTCDDSCVSFGKPCKKGNKVALRICDGDVLLFKQFKDERFSSETEQQLSLFTRKPRKPF